MAQKNSNNRNPDEALARILESCHPEYFGQNARALLLEFKALPLHVKQLEALQSRWLELPDPFLKAKLKDDAPARVSRAWQETVGGAELSLASLRDPVSDRLDATALTLQSRAKNLDHALELITSPIDPNSHTLAPIKSKRRSQTPKDDGPNLLEQMDSPSHYIVDEMLEPVRELVRSLQERCENPDEWKRAALDKESIQGPGQRHIVRRALEHDITEFEKTLSDASQRVKDSYSASFSSRSSLPAYSGRTQGR